MALISRDLHGRFIRGIHYNPSGEIKKGDKHWRPSMPYWNRDWLYEEYTIKQRSAGNIASEFHVTPAAIIFWLRKYNIKRRSYKEAKALNPIILIGENNGMFGRVKEANPNWNGGITPERQSVYVSKEWKLARKIVWNRDSGKCRRCGRKRRLQMHHLVSFSSPDLRTEPDNIVLLCRICHVWVHSNKNINKDYIREEVGE